MSRVFVWRDPLLNKLLKFPSEVRTCCYTLPEYDECLRGMEFGGFSICNDGHFQNTVVLDQRTLDFGWRDPLTRDSEHIVRTAGIPVIALFIDPILVASEEPFPSHALRGELWPIPVASRNTFARDEEISYGTWFNLAFV